MERLARWVAAALVTVAVFTLPTWICGALLLPSVLREPTIRWGLASALGLAMAALAGLWGYGFATNAQKMARDRELAGPMVRASGLGSVAVGGSNQGSISTGNAAAPLQSPLQAAGEKPASPQLPVAPTAGPVTASGERSIAIGGDSTGMLSTGDQNDGAPW